MDKAELAKERAVFECDVAKKEKQKFVDLYNQAAFDLNSLRQKHETLEVQFQEVNAKAQQQAFENQRIAQSYDQACKASEQYQRLYQQEQRAREQESFQLQQKVRELEDQLGEYEEDNMNLQNQMYQQKTQYEQFMKAGGGVKSALDISASKQTDISRISKKANDHEYGGGIDDLEDEQENQNTSNQPGSQQNPDELDDKSKKIQELLGDMIQMRKRLKKEEESKRQYQDISRKKEEEVKKLRTDFSGLEKKLQEEEGLKNREKNLVMQRDNKIKVLEDKLKQFQNETDQKKGN